MYKTKVFKRLLIATTFTVAVLFISTDLKAQLSRPLSQEAEISVLTCSPGDLIYELFGHSGLRVYDPVRHIDIVFNYGIFNLYSDNFIFNFVTGHTDYRVGIEPFGPFCRYYEERGSGVTECVLDLNYRQKQQLWQFLTWNILPENQVYRYNFVFENCATKIRDAVEAVCDTGIIYQTLPEEPITYRQAIKLYTENAGWSQFGFDICLGAGADELTDTHHLMFLPELMDKTFATAKVECEDGQEKLLYKSHEQIVFPSKEQEPLPLSPLVVFWSLFGCILTLTVLQTVFGWKLYWLDAILFTINALVGCIILFLMLFSEHPFTGCNYNILWLNPIMICPLFIYATGSKFTRIFYLVVCIMTGAALLCSPFITQQFNVAFYPLMLMYFTRGIYRTATAKP